MSDFLSRLIGRSFGLIPVARPLLPSLYAPDWSMPEAEPTSGLEEATTEPLPATEQGSAPRIASLTEPPEAAWSEPGSDSALPPLARSERAAQPASESARSDRVRGLDPQEPDGAGRPGFPPPHGLGDDGASVLPTQVSSLLPGERSTASVAPLAVHAELKSIQVSAYNQPDVWTQDPEFAAWPPTESEPTPEPPTQRSTSVSAEPLRSSGARSIEESPQLDSAISLRGGTADRRADAIAKADVDGGLGSSVLIAAPPALGDAATPEEPEPLVPSRGAGPGAVLAAPPSAAGISAESGNPDSRHAVGVDRFGRVEIGLVPEPLSSEGAGPRADVASPLRRLPPEAHGAAASSVTESGASSVPGAVASSVAESGTASAAASEEGVAPGAREPLLLPASALPILAESDTSAAQPRLRDVLAESTPVPSESVPDVPSAADRSERAVQAARGREPTVHPTELRTRRNEAPEPSAAQSDPVHQALQLARLLPFHPERQDAGAPSLPVEETLAEQASLRRAIAGLRASSPAPQQVPRFRSRAEAAEPRPAEPFAVMDPGSPRSQNMSMSTPIGSSVSAPMRTSRTGPVQRKDPAYSADRAESAKAGELTRSAAREGAPLLLPPLAAGEDPPARSPDLLAAAARAQGPSFAQTASAGVASASGAARSRVEAAFSAGEPPRVHVGIGRIEVHAAPPPAPPAPQIGAAAPAASSLDDYLRSLGGKIL